jgi:hypothetical protein
MAVWSVVRISQFAGAFRLDAEFWQPDYLTVERALEKIPHQRLGALVKSLRKGVFNILAESYVEQGVPFYRSSNVGEIIPKEADLAFITPAKHALERKTSLMRGDIMLAKTGKEAASVVLCDECNISQDVIGVRVDRKKVDPFYLAVFLNTAPGILQMRRWFQGQVQLHLSLPDARQILVPLPPEDFQERIADLVHQAEAQFARALMCMTEAEKLLASGLGLDKLDLSPSLFYQRSYAEMLSAGRFDAEYFSPRYQQVLRQLARDDRMIGDVASLARRMFQARRLKGGDTFRYIEIGSVARDGRAETEGLEVAEAPSRAKWIVERGDVITSMVRPIRRLSAIITDEQDGAVCSSGFAVLRANAGLVEPELLLTYLRLPVICEILDLHTTASMYPAIPVDRLLRIPIALPRQSIAKEIVIRVTESFAARREARRLLDQAKTEVDRLSLGATGE